MIRGPERSAARRLACWAVLLAAAGLIGGGGGSGGHRVSASALALRPEDSLARLPYGVRGGGAEDPEAELPCRERAASTRTCEELGGAGSFDAVCVIASSTTTLSGDVCVHGAGSVEVRAGVRIACRVPGCRLVFNVSGSIAVGERAELVAGSVGLHAANVLLGRGSAVNTTGLAGAPPPQTSGTPHSLEGAGGGHGGRGASCKVSNDTNWGGDVYAWAFLDNPWSYGSKGGSLSTDENLGGDGGGRVLLRASEILTVDGVVLAEGGVGSLRGGGGSGGSIMIKAFKLYGNGTISAGGGNGWGGGGGGRISLKFYSIQQDLEIIAHGGQSFGCPQNAGAAGTIYDKSLETLKVSNGNFTTHTETPLLGFSVTKLWSNVLVESNAKVLVPLLWSRVQVTGQIRLLTGGSICFGLSENPISEFELVAEELLMSDSVIKVYGAFRMYVKVLLMWDSKIQIDGGGKDVVLASMLEARNLVVLKHGSVISSNAALGVYGQGLLNLSGPGDGIKARQLFLSLFYNIEVGPGSVVQAPLDEDVRSSLDALSICESKTCPSELIAPPDDCHVNSSLSFTIQICRVEDITVGGIVKGSIIHIHRARTVTVTDGGAISASELGCKAGIGRGTFLKYGAGGGAGHGGQGGIGIYNGMTSEGGQRYGSAYLPCELGSGTGSPESGDDSAGGGLIVIGSMKWPLARLLIYGSVSSNGESNRDTIGNSSGSFKGGIGGGSGGTILFFLQGLLVEKNSSLSASGGKGGIHGGGGGGGGRIHFHWSNIATGDEFVQIASINGTVASSGGSGNDDGHFGEDGTITGKECPVGLYGTFCTECPVGTYKNVAGSNSSLCTPCSLNALPNRADFIYVRGGVTQPSCPYKCISAKYKMPNCYTPLEEVIYTFGGPWSFAVFLFFAIILLALILSAVRVKIGESEVTYRATSAIHNDAYASSPFLLSLAEVPGASRAEETQSHVHRMYFMGPNTFREPWHLPYSPPESIIGIVYEDAFNRFIDEINLVAAFEWWEGSVHSILAVLAYPCAWSWKQWRRRKKIHRLQEYVKSEYDHSCLRSCRSRALYKGLKVGSTPDLMVAYIDFFLGGDEKRLDVAATIQKRFPMCLIFGGEGSYMSPYHLHSDTLLSNLLGQYVSTAIWNRLVAGLNTQLRSVKQGSIRSTLGPVVSWIKSHGNPQLERHGVRVELGWFQATASGYYQLGIVVAVNENFYKSHHHHEHAPDFGDRSRKNFAVPLLGSKQAIQDQPCTSYGVSRKRLTGGVTGGVINEETLKSLDYKRDYLFPLSLLLQNCRPIGYAETLQLLICIVLVGDFTITLLMLVQYYWISVGAFLAVLLIPPLALLSPFLAGLNALFSRGPKRSSVTRIFTLWNTTSVINIIVAIVYGAMYSGLSSLTVSSAQASNSKSFKGRDDDGWWILPVVLFVVKSLQAGLVNWHIANLEIQDHSLFSPDPDRFWTM
ncbi:uncharacterized protein LOC119352753 [Triticum dicoccoides]|uniref:uncharacterized protein LOC119352753 n=1 Tax=Triticum dicoccoides TaxID=85692 RepID=UPI0018909600|nr:uncharacterized protein LOC119352753 [Triticum dicoccoides]